MAPDIKQACRRLTIGALLCAATLSVGAAQSAPTPPALHRLTIDDVFGIQHIDNVALSPDGEWAAVVVSRPARDGEVYGRAAYEIDPGRNDVWLVSTRTGERRNITNGAARAAGYWCATWSPDGRRLAMLSTQPERGESRGGDNVRLYVWERAGGLRRMSDDAVMTQTRYGSGIDRLDLRGGGDRSTIAHICADDENAPFLWLDDHRLLAAMLPRGQVSGLLDQYGRAFRSAAVDAARLNKGVESTGRAMGSGAARSPRDEAANSAILRIVDTGTRAMTTVATVPTYPFRGALTVSVSPDGRQLAVLATLGALQPREGKVFPNNTDDAWTVERRLGFVDLAASAAVRWAVPPAAGRYPLELYGWSPDSRRVAWRGRDDPFATTGTLLVATAADGAVRTLGATSVGNADAGSLYRHDIPVAWRDGDHLVARLNDDKPSNRSDWWLLGLDGSAARLATDEASYPNAVRVAGNGRLVLTSDNILYALDPARPVLTAIPRTGAAGPILWPVDTGRPDDNLLFYADDGAGNSGMRALSLTTGKAGPLRRMPGGTQLVEADMRRGTLLWIDRSREGLFLRAGSADGQVRDLMALDTGLAAIDWGKIQLIDYKGSNGQDLKGGVILPPGYQPGRRYPTLFWVYEGYEVRSDRDYWFDPMMPGIYNLQLYAARGYVVVIPSMPFPREGGRGDVYAKVTIGVLPAIDRMVALGITDPDRVGVMGQSYGGYSVYALLTQTDRFRAGVAIAGLTDLAGAYTQFDPGARGFGGIEHERSDNWSEAIQFGREAPPWRDADGYRRISPLTYVDRVNTPLLMIHGEFDIRGGPTQADQFFYALYSQGKTAQLVRYGGESHSLSQSPANVRDIYARMIGWFDTYVKK